MNPPDHNIAKIWHRRLTFTYVLTAWTILGLVVYQIRTKDPNFQLFNSDGINKEKESRAVRLAKSLHLKNPTIIRYSWDEGVTRQDVVIPVHEALKPKPLFKGKNEGDDMEELLRERNLH